MCRLNVVAVDGWLGVVVDYECDSADGDGAVVISAMKIVAWAC